MINIRCSNLQEIGLGNNLITYEGISIFAGTILKIKCENL